MCVVPQRILVTDLSQWFNLQRITFFAIFLLITAPHTVHLPDDAPEQPLHAQTGLF